MKLNAQQKVFSNGRPRHQLDLTPAKFEPRIIIRGEKKPFKVLALREWDGATIVPADQTDPNAHRTRLFITYDYARLVTPDEE